MLHTPDIHPRALAELKVFKLHSCRYFTLSLCGDSAAAAKYMWALWGHIASRMTSFFPVHIQLKAYLKTEVALLCNTPGQARVRIFSG